MKCFCRHNPCVNLVRVYQDCQLIYTKEGFFEIVCPPKVCVKQRLIKVDNTKNMIRLIIKVFNFERLSFEGIQIINELKPIPLSIFINKIDGVWCYRDGKLCVCFPLIPELSVSTIDYLVNLEKSESIESYVYLNNKNSELKSNSKLKVCKSYLKL